MPTCLFLHKTLRSLNTFVCLLLMRLSESIRRNSLNFKYIAIVMSLLSALFISGALGFFYENCANALETAELKAIKQSSNAQCPGIDPVTTAGPGSVLATLGLCFMLLLPVVLCPQPSDPEPLAGKTDKTADAEVTDSQA